MTLQPPPKPERRYLAGQVVADRYALIRQIGRGGMGVVWLAHSVTLDVDVAIKLISRRGSIRRAMVQRLAQEARAAARFGHPAIVRVFDFGQTESGDPFLVMELLEGEGLAELLETGPRMPALRAVQTLLPIADALATAHDGGIVHRDVKPENIFLSRDKVGRVQPKLLDFGIVKMMDEDDIKLTKVGVALGSPEYMSPEQARGRSDVDLRGDVWAFCVVLYELLTGQVPFQGDNYNSIMRAIIEETPLPTTELRAGDAQLWRILERGLQKKPDDRWQSMWELGEALALWLYEHGVKEDICAASLRTSWLEAGFSGVKVEVVSHSPPPLTATRQGFPVAAPRLSPIGATQQGLAPARESAAAGADAATTVPDEAGGPPEPAVLDTPVGVRVRGRARPAIAAAVAVLGGLGLWAALRSTGSGAHGAGAHPGGGAAPVSAPLQPKPKPAPTPAKPAATVESSRPGPRPSAAPSGPARTAPPAPARVAAPSSHALSAPHASASAKKPRVSPPTKAPAVHHAKSASGDLDFGF